MPFEVVVTVLALMAVGPACWLVRLLAMTFRPRPRDKQTLAPAEVTGAAKRETVTIICLPIVKTYGIVRGSRQDQCGRCFRQVYLGPQARKLLTEKTGELLCTHCAREIDPEIPGLPAMIRDLERSYAERN